jgi:hypothetical protein
MILVRLERSRFALVGGVSSGVYGGASVGDARAGRVFART